MDNVQSYEHGRDEIGWTSGGLGRAAAHPHNVYSHTELLRKIAALAYWNKQFSLLFRGQSEDYKYNVIGEPGTHSHLYPAILRTVPGISKSAVDMKYVLERRFSILAEAERLLKEVAHLAIISTDQIVRWSLLQHYEACPTPLLDVSQSLQVALSFAMEKPSKSSFLFVLAVPQITDTISVSVRAGTQVVRLSQVCPPEALRPHFQEASLIGHYPSWNVDDLLNIHHGKLTYNFAGRLLAKFQLNNCKQWESSEFQPTSQHVLRPNHEDTYYLDTMRDVAERVEPLLDELRERTKAIIP